jgi:ABC-type amino acid transport substrate-binding protein
LARPRPNAALIGLALTVALLGGPAAGPASARTLEAVKSSGVLRVTVYRDYKPWSWEENGSRKGIDVDIGAALAKAFGVRVDYLFLRADDDLNDDLRNGVWRGSLLGEEPGDVMLHVPHDPHVEAANDRIKLTDAYQVEGLAMAVEAGKGEKAKDFSLFETEKVAVDLGTLSDLILLSARDHKLIDRVVHVRGEAKAAEAFDRGEVVAFYGEAALVENLAAHTTKPLEIVYPEHKLARTWSVGGAVKASAVDLADAIDEKIGQLASSGELKNIFASYGVTWRPPAQER